MTRKLSRWMPMFWADYWQDTGGLSCAHHGAYLNLIGECWVRGGLLPDDNDELWRMARADGPQHWVKLKEKVLKKFQRVEGGWRHKRIDVEIARQGAYQASQSEKGVKGARKRWQKPDDDRGNGSGGGKPITGPMTPAMPIAPNPIAGALPGHCPADGSPEISKKIPPYPPPEPDGGALAPEGRAPPTQTPEIPVLKPIPGPARRMAKAQLDALAETLGTARPLSPSEVRARKAKADAAPPAAQREVTTT